MTTRKSFPLNSTASLTQLGAVPPGRQARGSVCKTEWDQNPERSFSKSEMVMQCNENEIHYPKSNRHTWLPRFTIQNKIFTNDYRDSQSKIKPSQLTIEIHNQNQIITIDYRDSQSKSKHHNLISRFTIQNKIFTIDYRDSQSKIKYSQSAIEIHNKNQIFTIDYRDSQSKIKSSQSYIEIHNPKSDLHNPKSDLHNRLSRFTIKIRNQVNTNLLILWHK